MQENINSLKPNYLKINNKYIPDLHGNDVHKINSLCVLRFRGAYLNLLKEIILIVFPFHIKVGFKKREHDRIELPFQ